MNSARWASRWMRRGSSRTSNSASPHRRGDPARHPGGTAPCAGALARAGRGTGCRRHRPLRGQQHRAAPGTGFRLGGRTLHPRLQRPCGAAGPHGNRGRVRRRHPLQGLGPAERPAPHHPRPGTSGVRRVRPLDRPQPGRADPPCLPPRRPQLRDAAGQRQRSRGPPPHPLPALRPHPRPDGPAEPPCHPGRHRGRSTCGGRDSRLGRGCPASTRWWTGPAASGRTGAGCSVPWRISAGRRWPSAPCCSTASSPTRA